MVVMFVVWTSAPMLVIGTIVVMAMVSTSTMSMSTFTMSISTWFAILVSGSIHSHILVSVELKVHSIEEFFFVFVSVEIDFVGYSIEDTV